VLGIALIAGFALRAWLAVSDQGLYWPDEIYQSLEPAHRLVFGTGLIAWEFVQGARSWAFPGFVAGLLELSRLLVHGPRGYLAFVKLVFALIGAATAWATWRLARASGASPQSASLGALAFALSAPAIYFAPRAMSETAAALPITLGLALLLARPVQPERRTGGPESKAQDAGGSGSAPRAWSLASQEWTARIGALLLGLSVFLRLQAGLFCVGVLVILLVRKQHRRALETLAILTALAFAYGLLDRLTWGGWFQSAAVYLRFNVIENRSAGWGTADAMFYLRTLFSSMPGLFALVGVLAALSLRRAPGLWLLAAAFLAAHMLVPHKELRFVFPLLPLLCALAAVGLDGLSRLDPRSPLVGQVALALAAVLSGARFHALTFGQIGAYPDRPQASAYGAFGEVNRLLLRAHDLPDLCGLAITVHPAWSGGYSYLDRDVPLYSPAGPRPTSARGFNYVIAPRGNYPAVVVDGPLALVKRFDGPCDKDPTYSWRLP
jgi:phosphatidylinositol glycan class B